MDEPHFGKLPSWVPDWSNKNVDPVGCLLRDFHDLKVSVDSRPNYKASGESSFQPLLNHSKQTLLLKGYFVGTIDEISKVIEFHAESQRRERGAHKMAVKVLQNVIIHARLMHSIEKTCLLRSLSKTYPTGEKRFDAFCQTLCAGKPQGDFASSQAGFRTMHRKYRLMRPLQILHLDRIWFITLIFYVCIILLTLGCCGLERWMKWLPKQKDSEQFTLDVAVSTHRRVMRTRTGLMGLVPRIAQQGDLITLCRGGKLPIVLRAQGDGFRVVGDSYMHGLTDGSAWNMLEGTAERSGGIWDAIRADVRRKEFWVS